MRYALTQALIALLLAAPATAAAAAPPFEWTMPARLGPDRDGDGLVDYANDSTSVPDGPFAVVLRARRDLCLPSSVYRWSVEERLLAGGRGDCRTELRVAGEGSYDVELEIEAPDGSSTAFSSPVEVQDWLIVSIGDSVASGEGNPDRPGFFRHARWQSPRCHRSTLAAPAQAALAVERSDPRTSTTFVHLACSGAGLGEGLLEAYEGADVPRDAKPKLLPPQIEELEAIASQRQVDAVLVNVGANDLHFAPAVIFCLRFAHCVERGFDPDHPLRSLKEGEAPSLAATIEGSLPRLRTAYAALGARLDAIVDPGRVAIVEYFDPTRGADGETCGRIGPPGFSIDRGEASWAYTGLLAPLNREIAAAAEQQGWREVAGVTAAFERHGYCAGGDSWIRGLGRSLASQAGDRLISRALGMLHPNEQGHAAIARSIAPTLLSTLYSAATEPAPPAEESRIVEAVEEGEDGVGEVLCGCGGEAADDASCACGEDPAGDLEKPAWIALAAAIAASVLVLLLTALWPRDRSRSRGQDWNDAEREIPPFRDAWKPPEEGAHAFGTLLERSRRWVHRRVESIEFLDESTIRRRVSVDFTPADGGIVVSPTYAPIALLHKGVLTRFDLRDEAGDSLPLLTANQNAAFAAAHMLELAERVIGGPPPDRLRELCWTIARAERRQAQLAIEEIAQRLEPAEARNRLRDDSLFRSVTQTFADNFPVIVRVDDPNRRRVLKLAYDEALGRKPRPLVRLGLRPLTMTIGMAELGDAASRHIEFLRAEGLEMFDPALAARTPAGRPLVRRTAARARREVHLLVTDAPRGTVGVAGVRLRAKREGILTSGPLIAVLAASLLTLTWFALPEVARNSSETASVLLAIPAALGAYLGARSPHPLVAAMLAGARGLLVVSGILSFAAAAALALACSVETLRIVLGVTASLSWVTSAGLATIGVLPKAPRKVRPEGT